MNSLLLSLLLLSPAAEAPASADALVVATRAQHPDLEAVDARLSALAQAERRSWAWSDPMVGVEYSNMPVLAPWPGNHPMSGVQLKVQQAVPFPTKLSSRAAAAAAEQHALEPLLHEAKNRLAASVRRRFVRYERAGVRRARR